MIISYSIFTMFMHCCGMMFHRHPVLGPGVGTLADDAGHIQELHQQQPQELAVGGCVSKMRMTTPWAEAKCIAAYNKYMGGVDLSDRKIYHVSAERPSKRYWKKIFFNLLDMALFNSLELYHTNTDVAQCLNQHDFMCSILESLCAAEEADEPALQPALPHPGRHEIDHLPSKR